MGIGIATPAQIDNTLTQFIGYYGEKAAKKLGVMFDEIEDETYHRIVEAGHYDWCKKCTGRCEHRKRKDI